MRLKKSVRIGHSLPQLLIASHWRAEMKLPELGEVRVIPLLTLHSTLTMRYTVQEMPS